MVVVIHHSLYLPLVVEARDLIDGLVAILVPQAVNGVLTLPLFPLCILPAFPVRLRRCYFNCVRTAIGFLFRLLLFVTSAQILRHHNGILVQGRIGSHCHTTPCLARRQLSILIRLVVHMSEIGVGLLLGCLAGNNHLLLGHLRRMALSHIGRAALIHVGSFLCHA